MRRRDEGTAPTARSAKKPLPQVGKRPTPPAFLLAIGVIWVVAAVVLLFTFHSSWKLVPVVFAFGVGGLYLRGGLTAFARRDDPSS